MTTLKKIPLKDIRAAAQDYINLLGAAERTTSELILAIKGWDPPLVDALIAMRETLCHHVAQSTRELDAMIRNLVTGSGSDGSFDKLEAIIEEARAGQRRLMLKQAECESILSTELRQVEHSLMSLSQNRGLKQTYRAPAASQQARFLDSRL